MLIYCTITGCQLSLNCPVLSCLVLDRCLQHIMSLTYSGNLIHLNGRRDVTEAMFVYKCKQESLIGLLMGGEEAFVFLRLGVEIREGFKITSWTSKYQCFRCE